MQKGLRGVWFAILILMVIAFVGVVWWAGRTHWRTYTFAARPEMKSVVAIDCPESWQPDGSVPDEDGGMTFKPKPPTGWNRWWIKNILRQPINASNYTRILIRLQPLTIREGKDIDSTERIMRSVNSHLSKFIRKFSISRNRYRLGPALDYTQELRQTRTTPPASCTHGIAIFPDTEPEYNKAVLIIDCETTPDQLPRLESVIEGMAQRIQLLPADKEIGLQAKRRS
jgi:hypothetical protein